MEQTKYTVFFNEFGFIESNERYPTLRSLVDIANVAQNMKAICWMYGGAFEDPRSEEELRAESIAAGRTIDYIDGRYIPRGVPEETKEKTPEGVTAPAKSPLQTLRDLVEIQGRDGTWNCDDYMLGMFNGMELALATMEGRDPQFRTLKPRPVAESTAKPALLSLTSSPDLTGEWKPFEFGSAHLIGK